MSSVFLLKSVISSCYFLLLLHRHYTDEERKR